MQHEKGYHLVNTYDSPSYPLVMPMSDKVLYQWKEFFYQGEGKLEYARPVQLAEILENKNEFNGDFVGA